MRRSFAFVGAMLTCSLLFGQVADDIIGIYRHVDTKYDLTIEIAVFKRNENNYGCRIIQIFDHKQEQKVLPYKAKNNRPLIGTDLMEQGLSFVPDKKEWRGKIYHPAWKYTLSCIVTFPKKDHLRIYAYIGPRRLGLGDSLGWTRVSKTN